MPPILELKDITKRFPGVVANDHISLTLESGEIHALLGENGAGKTTLMNILYGLLHPDEGSIIVRGQEVRLSSPREAIKLGIGMVHQHFMLIPPFTVTENVMLGDETIKNGFLDQSSVAERIREISQQYSLDVDPAAYVRNLSVGAQQRVEIMKILYRHADILILDEPTAVLTPQEVEDLFKVIHELTAQNAAIIFISHKLKEVMEIADRVTVLRGGRVVGTTRPSETTPAMLAQMMVGRAVALEAVKEPAKPGEVVLQVEHLQVLDNRKNAAVQDVSFEVRSGEVLGIAGVQGNGQTELVEALTGLRPVAVGTATILGQDITHATSRQIFELGVAHVPEDRQADGLVLTYSVEDNMVLDQYYGPPFAKGLVLDRPTIQQQAASRAKEYDVRTPSLDTHVANLSGGNQQKVIVARELSRPIELLIASQPTRGLDVGSIEY
ncbi:MAG TPA: ABC transporter ATP-binding protein, partial [Aggregatilineales bacterium]|nr:ABC transporter ATP-binding protein [Aggregatilineales bacterium]